MDFIALAKAAFIALVCGITELLPVSSNGHVIILGEVLGLQGPPGKMFEMSLQLGAILAVCWLYRAKLWRTARCIATNSTDRKFALNIAIAFLPAALVGFKFHRYITEHLFNAHIVAVMLILGGIGILIVEKVKPAPTLLTLDTITMRDALVIGLFQMFALVPGVSRSGATIMGALLLGVERRVAAEFSFFLAIPVIIIACAYDFYVHRGELAFNNLGILATGFAISLFCALVVVQWLLGFLSRHGFVPFAWYRIIIGSLTLLLLAVR